MVAEKGGISSGKYLHMRCVAHIVNLIVGDGLKEHSRSVARVRAAVNWVKNSPSRVDKFKQYVDMLTIESKTSLSLDVPTRWNSTYLMLSTALKFQRVFNRIDMLCNPDFQEPKHVGAPDDDDWKVVSRLVVFLKNFYDLTNKVSASLFVIGNTALWDIAGALLTLNKRIDGDDVEFQSMARRMKEKHEKYWGDVEKMNMLIFISVILNPKMKVTGMEVALETMYGENISQVLLAKVKPVMIELFDEYKNKYCPEPSMTGPSEESTVIPPDDSIALLMDKLRKKQTGVSDGGQERSEYDHYLTEVTSPSECKDVLTWWKHVWHVIYLLCPYP